MLSLLEKTRRINRILQEAGGKPVDFLEVCEVLKELTGGNIYIVSRKGKILGYELINGFECEPLRKKVLDNLQLTDEYRDWLLEINETQVNLLQRQAGGCVFLEDAECIFCNKISTVVPVICGGERLGTLIIASFTKRFNEEDVIIAEYGAAVIGLEILRARSEEVEEEARKKAAVQMAIGTLSYSELEAVEHIFSELEGMEGLLVASKIADKVGITRSAIVNALRKLESAGIIESRSLGMKGTYIKVINSRLLDELKKIK
jgi:transcriptional pleiotropic repressor